MMTTTSRMVSTIPVHLQLKTTMKTIHHRTKAWTERLHQQAGPQKTATTTLPNRGNTTSTTTKTKVGYVVVPHTKGLSETFKNICGKYGIQVHFKGNTTIKQTLMKPKDQDPRTTKVD